MDKNKTVVVKREWIEVAFDIFRFFLQHSTVEYDGMNKKARVKYNGPNGWNVCFDASFSPEIQMSIGAEDL